MFIVFAKTLFSMLSRSICVPMCFLYIWEDVAAVALVMAHDHVAAVVTCGETTTKSFDFRAMISSSAYNFFFFLTNSPRKPLPLHTQPSFCIQNLLGMAALLHYQGSTSTFNRVECDQA